MMPLFRKREQHEEASPSAESLPVNYARRLAYIGRRLDDEKHRSVTILEISGNFIVRALTTPTNELHLTELVPEDFRRSNWRLLNRASPSSYEALLAAIGNDLDRRAAGNIAIIEGPTGFRALGWQQGEAGGDAAYVPFEHAYDRAALSRTLEKDR